MAEPPEFWVFAVTNLVVFGFGSVLTVLSYLAYRSQPTASFRNAALGFGLITLAGLVDPIYQVGIRGDHDLTGRELLATQGMEGALLALGLGMLFYSIKGYHRSSRTSTSTVGPESNDPR